MVVCIDFDGTLVEHCYPLIGEDIGAVPILKELLAAGHKLILFTMRSGTQLDEAVEWCAKRDIKLYGINENPQQKSWTASPKAYANLYIDDAALGVPLIYPENKRPYVDWIKVREYLVLHSIL